MIHTYFLSTIKIDGGSFDSQKFVLIIENYFSSALLVTAGQWQQVFDSPFKSSVYIFWQLGRDDVTVSSNGCLFQLCGWHPLLIVVDNHTIYSHICCFITVLCHTFRAQKQTFCKSDPRLGISGKPRPISGKFSVFRPLVQHETISVYITTQTPRTHRLDSLVENQKLFTV